MKIVDKIIILSFIFPFILFNLHQNISAQNYSKEKTDQIKLVEILKKTGEYCRRLENAIFNFVCLEEISERIDHSRDIKEDTASRVYNGIYFKVPLKKIERNNYIYDYQLIRKEGKTKERRILLKENGKKRYEKYAQLKTAMFYYENVIFGPLGLLSEYWQSYHDYKIVSEEIMNGEKTAVIEAIPKSSLKQYHLFGKIWIKESDFSILKIEWDQKSMINSPIIETTAKHLQAEPKITLISEYKFEKSGVRFPSSYRIEEAYINKKGKKFIRSETTVTYKDYKFFTVETEVKH